MMLVLRRQLVSGRPRLDAAMAIEAHTGHVDVVDDGSVVYVGNVDRACVAYSTIVEEGPAAPVATLESNSSISEAVVDTAIKADVWPPVAGVPYVEAIDPAPVTGCPEESDRRWQHPCTGYPVIAVVTISPITRRPYVAGLGKRRLHVYRERRWRDVDRYPYHYAGERCRGKHWERGKR